MLSRTFFTNVFFLFLAMLLCSSPRIAYASNWQIIDYQNGRGSIAVSNISIQNTRIPAWASLSVDFGIGRECYGGLGLNFRKTRILGKLTKQYTNDINSSLHLNINGLRWDKVVESLVIYEGGFEAFISIDEQSLMNALMDNTGEAQVTYKYQNQAKAIVAFSLNGSSSAISGAYKRCRSKLK